MTKDFDDGGEATAEQPKGADTSVIKTAGRVFAILEYMREQRREVTVREISDRLGYPRSSTQLLLKSIAALGFLRYDLQERAFFGTSRLAQLGDWVLESSYQGGRWLDLVQRVAEASQETGILAIENDIYAQYVHVILSRRTLAFNIQPGTRRLLAMSGLGWALLSRRSESEIDRVIHRTNVRLQRGGQKVDRESVLAHVHEVRERGFACSFNTVTEGIGVIAMPLPGEKIGGERVAIGVGGLSHRLESAQATIVDLMGREIARVVQTKSKRTVSAN